MLVTSVFDYLVRQPKVVNTLKWNDFNMLMFTMAHDNCVTSEQVNFICKQSFLNRLKVDFENEKVIKALTSFALLLCNIDKPDNDFAFWNEVLLQL